MILADGVNSLLATRAGLREDIKAEHAALAVKEMLFLPKETIEAFQYQRVYGRRGTDQEMLGSITEGMVGTGFLYTNKDSSHWCRGTCLPTCVSKRPRPAELLERMKAHPAIAPLIEGAETREYAAHLTPEGGTKSCRSCMAMAG